MSTGPMELVLVESPYAAVNDADIKKNLEYLRAALADCFNRNEAPFASHGLYTQKGVLDDKVPEQRTLGIEAGLLWGSKATKTVVYVDRGISNGMLLGIERAKEEGRKIELRSLGWHWIDENEAGPIIRFLVDWNNS